MRGGDQRGSTSVAFVLAWAVIMLSVALAADFGRIFVIREQLRTAEDAAALAGALQLDYKVEVVLAREQRFTTWICADAEISEGEEPVAVEDCWLEWWEPIAELTLEDWEFKLWPKRLTEAWYGEACTGDFRCTPQEEAFRCWVEPIKSQADVESTARMLFKLNERWGEQAMVRSVKVGTVQDDHVGPEQPRTYAVLVEGELEMKMYLLAALGLETIPVKTLEAKPGPARAELVRRSKPLEMTLGNHPLTSPCDAS